ncbi:MAG: tRNA 2-thiouridine(34) synthase MnmA [Actinobacteria bacterium]|nr:tRNA 2-thiouridine(34) synthase MnmA [Actinomycetota bacterium]
MTGARRIMVAMSGGVDSSVAAALLRDAGHDVVGVTLKLWGGESDNGCCSISDVNDARRVADHLGIEHHTFNFEDDFEAHVIAPYVAAHEAGRTPNPCIECNRHIKFARLAERADALGFASIATGHHARVVVDPRNGVRRIARGVDVAKDQSYVLAMLDQRRLAGLELPIGELTKTRVREIAADIGLRTAQKPDSQDVCFITSVEKRSGFLSNRMAFTPGTVVDSEGTELGAVDSVELVTIGQRRGLHLAGGGAPRYVLDTDVAARTVTVGARRDLLCSTTQVDGVVWSAEPSWGPLDVQTRAHGSAESARLDDDGDGCATITWDAPHLRVAPGQTVAFYLDDLVLGSGTAA